MDDLLEELDGCAVVMASTDYDDELTAELRPLFPGDLVGPVEWLAEQWRELFADGIPGPIPGEHCVCKVIDPATGTASPSVAEHVAAGTGPGFDVAALERLRAYGLKVIEVAGARTRGSSTYAPRGHLRHHTAGPLTGNAPSLGICILGRPDLPGPLAQTLQARDNTIYWIAAGRANHAGRGGWLDLAGNTDVSGNECENVGTPAEPWRRDQVLTQAMVAAAQQQTHGPAENVCDHKEWTNRKPDAHSASSSELRTLVQAFLAANPDPPKPEEDPDMTPADRALLDQLHRERNVPGLDAPVVGMDKTPTGAGYWEVAADGGVFNYGDAEFFGSMAGTQLDRPITGIAGTPTGKGYWLVAMDGGVFTFGDAAFHGAPA
jgi:hypothetical protein